MTSPWPTPPGVPPVPRTFPATAEPITIPALPCGHIQGDRCDSACAYWQRVSAGELPDPDTYRVGGEPVVLLPHAPGLAPLTDPALRGEPRDTAGREDWRIRKQQRAHSTTSSTIRRTEETRAA